ncbi:MAG: alpha/beta hydrolase [Mycobacterium sp.]
MHLESISLPLLVAEAGGDPWAINAALQHGRPAQIDNLARAFHHAGQSAAEADNTFEQARKRFEGAWNRENGDHPINDAAQVQLVTTSLGVQAAQLPNIAADLEGIAAALSEAQKSSAACISELEEVLAGIDKNLTHLLEVDKNSELTDFERSQVHDQIDNLQQAAIDDTAETLRRVKVVRDAYLSALRAAEARLRSEGYDPALVKALDQPTSPLGDPLLPIPAADTDPQAVTNWWNSLSPQQKAQLIAQHSAGLGNLNGAPADVRNEVNLAVLHDDLNRVRDVANFHGAAVDAVLKNPGDYGLSAGDVTRYRNAAQTEIGLEHLTGQVDADGNTERPAMLWAYDPLAFNGQGKAAVAIGNPDHAQNTAVVVPGTGNSVQQGWLEKTDATNLYDQMRLAKPGETTSVVAWMGYDAPDSPGDLRIATPWLARDGGAMLAGDVNGLSATHDLGLSSQVTVIGHSYGATTVADAFANSGMHANDAVLIGSPGTDLARSAADFHLDGGKVFVGAASSDPVSWLGEAGPLPNIINHGLDHPLGSTAGLGIDPTGDGFGSVRFEAETVGHRGLAFSDHSRYYDMGSESLRAMTDIASDKASSLADNGLIADGRRQAHIGLPEKVHIPFVGGVNLPHADTRVPGTPALIDPQGRRAPGEITNDHQYR